MSELIINGGRPLCGEIAVSGSKNAALPILFATLITHGVSRISRVPDIADVRVVLELIRGFGAHIMRDGDTLYIDTRNVYYRDPDTALISKIRASTYLLGASLARFGKCTVSDFGGCNFAKRPIDLHINACLGFGARKEGNTLVCEKLSAADISFSKRSVGATANALILAAATEGESRIRGHAEEPHIIALADFLRSAGAFITLSGDEILIKGGDLHGGSCEVIGDMIEAGSYLSAAMVTGGRIRVFGCDIRDMSAYLAFLESVGARIEISDGGITAEQGAQPRRATVVAEPYPAYPTDLQPIAASVLATCRGGEIYDRVFPERFGYLDRLSGFGVRYVRGYGFAVIEPSKLVPATADLPDLRGGMACLLCALGSAGESRLSNPEMLFRGYENIEEKLRSVGADIKFI